MQESKEKIEKKKYGFRLRPEVNELIETHKYFTYNDRSAFVTEAVRQYCADIDGEKNLDVLLDRISTNVRSISKNDTNRICHSLYKVAVELAINNYLLAAGYVRLDDEEMRNIRNRANDTVRRTRGIINFEDALEEERAYGVDD